MDKSRLIQLIHIAKNKLQLDEDTYRQMLQGLTGKASTKSMNIPDLNKVLDAMKKKGFHISPAKKAQSRLPLDDHPQSRKSVRYGLKWLMRVSCVTVLNRRWPGG